MTLPKVYYREAERLEHSDDKVQAAVEGLRNCTWKTSREAGAAVGCPKKHVTIWRRWKGVTKARKSAHAAQQLLKPPQEKVLLSWIKFLGATGTPLSKRTIAPKVEALCGKKPSRRWVYRFLRRHADCVMSRPSAACTCVQLHERKHLL